MKSTDEEYRWKTQMKNTDEEYRWRVLMKSKDEEHRWRTQIKSTDEEHRWRIQMNSTDDYFWLKLKRDSKTGSHETRTGMSLGIPIRNCPIYPLLDVNIEDPSYSRWHKKKILPD